MTKKPTENEDGSAASLPIEELVERLIGKCKDALENKKLKVTVTDLTRMRAFREERWPRKRQGVVTWRDGWG